MFASFRGDLKNVPPTHLFPNTSMLSHPALRIIGPLTEEDQKYYNSAAERLERIWERGANTPKQAPPPLSLEKELSLSEGIQKTAQAYQLFVSKPKTVDSYQNYFTAIDSLEELTRPTYIARTLRLATCVPIYLAAKTLAENQSPSPFDGKATTDPDLLRRAKTVVDCVNALPKTLERNPESIESDLVTLYHQFGQFCAAGAAHAARIDSNTNFALAKTHRNSIVLFTNALFGLVQKNANSETAILSALENGEERYLSLLPLLALYHLRYTNTPTPEVFEPIAKELSSLTVEESEISKLYGQFLGTHKGNVSETQKKGADLLKKLSPQLLTGIMRFAVQETIQALHAHAEAPSYPILVATLIRNQAIDSNLLSNPLAPEISSSLPQELQKFSIQQLSEATADSPAQKAIQTANRILSPELFGPLPNYSLLYPDGPAKL